LEKTLKPTNGKPGEKKKRKILHGLIYFMTVSFTFLSVVVLTNIKTDFITDHSELHSFDFSSGIGIVNDNLFEWYPWALYAPEDFAAGHIPQVEAPMSGQHKYGTYRLLLELRSGESFGIYGYSATSAMKLWVNGILLSAVGVPGSSLETMTAETRMFTAYFTAGSGHTEIIIQRSSFVHENRGQLYPLYVGPGNLITTMTELRNIRTYLMLGVTLVSALLFFGVYLFFNKSKHFLWYSLACVMIVLRTLTVTRFLGVLMPELSWLAIRRVEYTATILLLVFTFMFIDEIFEKRLNRKVLYIVIGIPLLYMPVVFFADSLTLTGFRFHHSVANMLAAVILFTALIFEMKKNEKVRRLENILVFVAAAISIFFSIVEIVLRMVSLHFASVNLVLPAMLSFVAINMIALAVSFNRTEAELFETKIKEGHLTAENEELGRLSRIKSEYMANLTHETKTPLAVISTHVQQAREVFEETLTLKSNKEFDGSEIIIESLEIAQEEVMRLSRFATNALWLASMQENREQMRLDIGLLINKSAEAYRSIIEKRGNILNIKTPDNLPCVLGESDRLVQVMVNLLTNANNHTENGKITVKAQIAKHKSQIKDEAVEYVHVTVLDTGMGIEPEILPQIFLRGVMGSQSKGNGMGLPISKSIIEGHGGKIEITSERGKGTEVTFTIPIHNDNTSNELYQKKAVGDNA
jgi:signal transduction histidine kinase